MLEEVSRIAAEAGRIAHARSGSEYRRWEKVPGHPVCDIDLEVDAYLRKHLSTLDPEAGWLSGYLPVNALFRAGMERGGSLACKE